MNQNDFGTPEQSQTIITTIVDDQTILNSNDEHGQDIIETKERIAGSVMLPALESFPSGIASSESIFFTDDLDTRECDKIAAESVEPSLIVSEDSIAFGEAHFDHLSSHFPEQTLTTVSSCFSRNRELECEDSLDASSKDPNNFLGIYKPCGDEVVEDDFFVMASEESSMDSGLGSVDSTYPNSEEESAPSPTIQKSPSPALGESNQNEECARIQKEESVSSSSGPDFYDCPQTGIDETASTKPKKREHPNDSVNAEEYISSNKRRKIDRKVGFQDVTVYYFPRKQSFTTVPSQGGSTLGMELRHVYHQTMTLQEHHEDMKSRHKEKIKEHFREQKIANKIQQLKFMNPDLDNGTISSMAQNAVGRNDPASLTINDDSVLDNFDEFFFLQPIAAKKRRKILRASGVDRIDGEEKLMNRILRESREMCGCTCEHICVPETCECALAGIQCQVDRESFPCGCAASQCQNENGRIEFDSDRVRAHLLATMEKLRLMQDGSQVEVTADQADNELESVASSESECDFMSSDDQSDADVADNPQRVHIKFDDAQTCICKNNDENTADFIRTCPNPPSNDVASTHEATETPSDEFLHALGLSKINWKCFAGNTSTKTSFDCTPSSGTVIPLSDIFIDNPVDTPHNVTVASFEQFSCMHNDNIHHHSTIESLAQSIPSPTDNPSPANWSMYGTTSTKSNSRESISSRDCSVLLDPIATFMTSSYNISSTSETIPCTSN